MRRCYLIFSFRYQDLGIHDMPMLLHLPHLQADLADTLASRRLTVVLEHGMAVLRDVSGQLWGTGDFEKVRVDLQCPRTADRPVLDQQNHLLTC